MYLAQKYRSLPCSNIGVRRVYQRFMLQRESNFKVLQRGPSSQNVTQGAASSSLIYIDVYADLIIFMTSENDL